MGMESDYGILVLIVSGITFLLLLVVFLWENWGPEWGTWARPVSFWEVFRDWIAYVLVFVMLLLLLRGLLCLVCSQCHSC